MTGFHEPTGWAGRHPWKQDGPGVHQIRLVASNTMHGLLVKCCCSSATLAVINPGDDCWIYFNEHLESVNDSHSAT